jgi:hypothetical protein
MVNFATMESTEVYNVQSTIIGSFTSWLALRLLRINRASQLLPTVLQSRTLLGVPKSQVGDPDGKLYYWKGPSSTVY